MVKKKEYRSSCTVPLLVPDFNFLIKTLKMPLHVRQHPLHNAHILPPDSPASQQLQQDRNHRQWNAVGSPDDGHKNSAHILPPDSTALQHLQQDRNHMQ